MKKSTVPIASAVKRLIPERLLRCVKLMSFLPVIFIGHAAGAEISGTLEMRHLCGGPAGCQSSYVLNEEKTGKLIQLDLTGFAMPNTGTRIQVQGDYLLQAAAEAAVDVKVPGEPQTEPVFKCTSLNVIPEAGLKPDQLKSVDDAPVQSADADQAQAEPSAAATVGAKRVLLVFVDSLDYTQPASRKTSVKNKIFTDVNRAMRAASYQQFGLVEGDTISVSLNYHTNGLLYYSIDPDIRAAAMAAGYDYTTYDHAMFIMPDGLDWRGNVAYAWYNISGYKTYNVSDFTHEVGHNIGFGHAREGTNEYGDGTCAMGNRPYNIYMAGRQYRVGWLDAFPGTFAGISTDACFEIHPNATDPSVVSGKRVVNISGTDVFVSYVRNLAPDSLLHTSSLHDKVNIHTVPVGKTISDIKSRLGKNGSYSIGGATITVVEYGPSNSYAMVNFDFADGNTKPVASAQTLTVSQNLSLAITLMGSDPDSGDTLSYETFTNPASGTLSGTAPNLIYTPTIGYVGPDSFKFKVSDGKLCAFATINITVGPTVNWTAASQASAGESGALTVTAQLSAASVQTVSVPFTVTGTATGADYTITASPITIAAGAMTGTATITITEDTIHELNNETVILTMDTPVNAIRGAMTVHTATITDDDNTAPVANAGPDQTVILIANPIALGWSHAPWTGDADSGISTKYNYTAKHSFGNNRTSATVNGVIFTEGNVTSGTGWNIGGAVSYWNGNDDAAVTGNSELLAQEFVHNANPRTVTFSGLTVGKTYEAVLYSVGWEAGSRSQMFSTPGVSSVIINQNQYGDNKGIRINCMYTATATTQTLTITPQEASTFHLYAITNREVSLFTATASLNCSASDHDDDPLTTTWSVVSKPANSFVAFANASAPNTTVIFDTLGTYVLRLTANDSLATGYDDVTITVTANMTGLEAFNNWAATGGGGIAFTDDANADGLADGMGWLLGAANPAQDANGLLPQLTAASNGNLTLSFKMLNSTKRSTAVMKLERSSDLGLTDLWTANVITIPDVSGTVDGVDFIITPINDTDHNQVVATVPAAAANGTGKLFVRLSGELAP